MAIRFVISLPAFAGCRNLRGKATSFSHCRRPAFRLPDSRLSAGPSEVFETWAFPSLSALFHQGQIARSSPLGYKLTLNRKTIWMRVGAEIGSGLMERPKKPGDDPIFGDGISPA